MSITDYVLERPLSAAVISFVVVMAIGYFNYWRYKKLGKLRTFAGYD